VGPIAQPGHAGLSAHTARIPDPTFRKDRDDAALLQHVQRLVQARSIDVSTADGYEAKEPDGDLGHFFVRDVRRAQHLHLPGRVDRHQDGLHRGGVIPHDQERATPGEILSPGDPYPARHREQQSP